MIKKLYLPLVALLVLALSSCGKMGELSSDYFTTNPEVLEAIGGKVPVTINGKDIKHYKLNKEGTILDAPIRLGWLYTEPHIGIWVVGKQGRVFQYEADRDDFKMVYKLPDTSEAISCGYLDRKEIWDDQWFVGTNPA